MCMSKHIVLVIWTLVLVGPVAAEGPDLGQEIPGNDLARWDISIQPDGEGLPEGSGTARTGRGVYQAKCQACHGQEGKGGPHDVLVGGTGSLASEKPLKTVGSYWPYATTLYDYIRRAMPYYQPRTLTDTEVYGLTAYLLYLNGIITETTVIDRDSLPQIKMPNRDNFIPTADIEN